MTAPRLTAAQRRVLECLRWSYGYAQWIGGKKGREELEASGLIFRPDEPRDAWAERENDYWIGLTPAGRAALDGAS